MPTVPGRRVPSPPCRARISSRRWRSARRYIRDGDIFQVVLSQRMSMPYHARPLELYRAMRTLNPSPYMFFVDLGDFQIASSSPEILVRLEQGEVTVRPIAGTRGRGATPEEDEALAEELLADPKELAEHLMLIDLGRNDVGRGLRDRLGDAHRQDDHRALFPRHAHRLQRDGADHPGTRRHRRAEGHLPRGHAVRCAQGACAGDHRGTGAGTSAASIRAPSAISAGTGTWIRPSPSAPR